MTTQGLDNYGSEAIYSVGASVGTSVGLSESSNNFDNSHLFKRLRLISDTPSVPGCHGARFFDGIRDFGTGALTRSRSAHT